MKSCLITGIHGYLGSELGARLKTAGWRVVGASRTPAEPDTIPFHLGDDIAASALAGIDALVHCAYDFGPGTWKDIHARNVVGTEKLLRAAREAGIKTIVTISSISAFDGCQSLYGRAKLAIEKSTFAAGGMVLRPGLIYGGSNRGMYGRLAAQAVAGRPVPLLSGAPLIQYLIHIDDLCGTIEALLSDRVPSPTEPWTVAHPRPWPLKELLTTIARTEGKGVRFIPIPWQLVHLGLKTAEILGLKLAFKSDSVKSLAHQNPRPKLGQAEAAGLPVREFSPD